MSINYRRICTVLLLLSVVVSFSVLFPSDSLGASKFDSSIKQFKAKISRLKKSIEIRRVQTRAKINELKKREKIEVGKLYYHQNILEKTKNDIETYQDKLDRARQKLGNLRAELNSLSIEQERTARVAGERIRQIYKGERISILHLIFAAQDIGTFFDRVYYQKRLAEYDKQLLEDLRHKTSKLCYVKQSLESEKNEILGTISVMNQKKREITATINTSQYLINKLRTDRATYESAESELASQSSALERRLRMAFLAPSNAKIHISGGFIRPLMGIITSPFGWRRHPIFGSRSFHTGVDIASSYGTPIHASNSGKVIYSGWYGGYGKVVIVNHGNYHGSNASTLYAHLSRVVANVGQSISKGQTVGYEGTTGYSTGPHLHFEVRINGTPTNPLGYIP